MPLSIKYLIITHITRYVTASLSTHWPGRNRGGGGVRKHHSPCPRGEPVCSGVSHFARLEGQPSRFAQRAHHAGARSSGCAK